MNSSPLSGANSSGAISSVIVLGGGTAGFFAALALRARQPHLPITLIRSPDLGTIGVGEGSTPALPAFLHGFLRISPSHVLNRAEATWKLGIKFRQWGERPHFNYTFGHQYDRPAQPLTQPIGFHCWDEVKGLDAASSLMDHGRCFESLANGDPVIPRSAAYHLETTKLAGLLEELAGPQDIRIIDDTVREVRMGAHGVESLLLDSVPPCSASLYIDASGFARRLIQQELHAPLTDLSSSLLCDRAIIGGWPRTTEPILPYTMAESMEAGWCWQIEHRHRINRGYVFASSFCSQDKAEHELRRRNPKITQTRTVPFKSGYVAEPWIKNVAAVGNAAGFVEPMEATALWNLTEECRHLANLVADTDGRPSETGRRIYNLRAQRFWESTRAFLALHYRFNNSRNTPFWKAARADTALAQGAAAVAAYREHGPQPDLIRALLPPHDPFGPEGYIALLLGMKVPWKNQKALLAADLEQVQGMRESFLRRGAAGLEMGAALQIVQAPEWSWRAEFYA